MNNDMDVDDRFSFLFIMLVDYVDETKKGQRWMGIIDNNFLQERKG